jgi:hypothetical protein
MNKSLLTVVLLIVTLLALPACNYSVAVSSSSVDPELQRFDIIDTYGNNSEFDPLNSLAISPYVNGGEFELFWDINSHQGYYTDLRINTRATLSGSQLVFSSYCDPDFPCHRNQALYCEYQSDFDVICEDSFGDIQRANIAHLISQIPERLYWIFEVCDGYGLNCDYQTIPVLME